MNPLPAIRSASKPCCCLCGSMGKPLHTALSDRLYSAPGTWNLSICSNKACGLVWLDPMPLSEDLPLAYASYYTHRETASSQVGLVRRAYRDAKIFRLRTRLGYPPIGDDRLLQVSSILQYAPGVAHAAAEEVRFLRFRTDGNLLDVGCGTGSWMAMMNRLGWTVEGVDFDPAAVAVARASGLDVRIGSLEEQGYPAATFDAITLSHVIEHLPDPLRTLRECERVLKPGGSLVLLTPNAASYSHRYFSADWRGLEPPRHLHIFNTRALRSALVSVGFGEPQVRTVVGTAVSFESHLLRKSRGRNIGGLDHNWRNRITWRALSLFQQMLAGLLPEVGECVLATAQKASDSTGQA